MLQRKPLSVQSSAIVPCSDAGTKRSRTVLPKPRRVGIGLDIRHVSRQSRRICGAPFTGAIHQ